MPSLRSSPACCILKELIQNQPLVTSRGPPWFRAGLRPPAPNPTAYAGSGTNSRTRRTVERRKGGVSSAVVFRSIKTRVISGPQGRCSHLPLPAPSPSQRSFFHLVDPFRGWGAGGWGEQRGGVPAQTHVLETAAHHMRAVESLCS